MVERFFTAADRWHINQQIDLTVPQQGLAGALELAVNGADIPKKIRLEFTLDSAQIDPLLRGAWHATSSSLALSTTTRGSAMPRHKTNENPVVSRSLIRNFLDQYNVKSAHLAEVKAVYDAEKRNVHDFRNDVIQKTSLLLEPVEWAVKKVRAEGADKCVTWLHAVVLTFAEMGVFRQADLFLVEELVEEIGRTKPVAA